MAGGSFEASGSAAFCQERETMIDLYNAATNQPLGTITEPELQVLVDALEEESAQDRDYYIDAATIALIADGKATDHLVHVLRDALGSADGVDIRWQRR
jgi:hypothetical protein